MRSVIPEAKLVFLVRDPVERIASHWLHNYAKGRELGDLRTTLHDPTTTYIARSCYFRQLRLFLDHFDESQILVLDASDLRLRRLYALRRVFAFLGVDPGFFHPGFDRTWHVTSQKGRATRLGQRVRQLSRTGAGRVVPTAVWKRLEAMPGLSLPLGPTPDVAEAIGPETMAVLREDAEQLRSHTGLPLSEWSVFADNSRRPANMGAAE